MQPTMGFAYQKSGLTVLEKCEVKFDAKTEKYKKNAKRKMFFYQIA
jgi:hypothetical protein